ncbi:MAG: hypothetical protein K2Y37_15610 [Pirellulales bacterium]|nr:hypothetical protein [Pirellulales bacterium]
MDESHEKDRSDAKSREQEAKLENRVWSTSLMARIARGFVLAAFGLLVATLLLALMPGIGSQPATRSAQAEAQRREQLIEQALRDAQAAGQFANEATELAVGDTASDDKPDDVR